MGDAKEMNERHGRILVRLAELGMSLAEQLHADAMAAQDPEVRASLATVFHRISRSLRQTLALEARLERDARRAEREERSDERGPDPARVEARKAELREPLQRAIRLEVEREDVESFLVELEDHLTIESHHDSFLTEAPHITIARLCGVFELTVPPFPPPSVEGVGSERPASTPTSPQQALRPDPGGPPPSAFGDASPNGGATGEPHAPDWRSSD